MVEQWIVAPKVVGSNPSSYPLNFFKLFISYNSVSHTLNNLKFDIINSFLYKSRFIGNYYLLNDLIWQEGLFLDFLQKKTIDNWIKKFLIHSANLFNERLVFDKVIRFYLDLLIWPMHKIFIFEFQNVGGILFINLFIFLFSFLFFALFYFFLILL